MVVDTSALLAILQDEPERRSFNEALESADSRLVSVATLVEISIIIEARYGAEGLRDLDLPLVPVDVEQARVARSAYSRFGNGRHPAALTFGDCFPYALARVLGEPLLFKGDDFSRTDLQPPLPAG